MKFIRILIWLSIKKFYINFFYSFLKIKIYKFLSPENADPAQTDIEISQGKGIVPDYSNEIPMVNDVSKKGTLS